MPELQTATTLPEDDVLEPTSHAEVMIATRHSPADVEAKSVPTLITEQEVLFGTAAALRPPLPRWWVRLAVNTRRVFATRAANQRPERRRYPRQLDFVEDARMAREMGRL
jgi:hypothetical protein